MYTTAYSLSREDIQTIFYGLASKMYGITSPHPFQMGVVEKAIRHCNTIVVQPTGKGKSLCYQVVALQTKKNCPSLHSYDCPDARSSKATGNEGVPAVVLGDSGQSLDTLSSVHSQAVIAYLTPEYIYGPSLSRRWPLLNDFAESGKISLIAINEAHLLFEWDHFRYI